VSAGIQAIYFDAVGTLLYPDPPAAVVYEAVARRLGSRLTLGTIEERFTAAFARQEALDAVAGFRTSEARELCRWRRIVAEVLDDVADAEACFQELYRHFARPEAWQCDPQAAPVLERLAACGILLGMASNYDQRLRAVVAGKRELRSVQRLAISSEVGWRKPAPEFFAALIAAADVPASGTLYVGDDPVNDFYGAEKCGIRAVLLDREGRHAATVPQRIERLADLVG
jgi:putative hydrolase of the HAD superfamily